ncbi:MAG: hypothetical protein P9X22_02520 [Candidatus Zapsychrus exili]|nr:hypothetical protein [Candidatus Zapsychrus exili]
MKNFKYILHIFLILLIFPKTAYCCIDSGAGFATEALLTDSEIEYDFSDIEEKVNTTKIKHPFGGSKDGFAYASNFNNKVVVIIGEDVMLKPLEEFSMEKFDIKSKLVSGFNIRIQIPYEYKRDESFMTKISTSVDYKTFDFSKAMETELLWLKGQGIIKNISDEDLKDITALTKRGRAGESNRIVYDEGKWLQGNSCATHHNPN